MNLRPQGPEASLLGNARARYQPAVLGDLSGPAGGNTHRSVGAPRPGRVRDAGLGGNRAGTGSCQELGLVHGALKAGLHHPWPGPPVPEMFWVVWPVQPVSASSSISGCHQVHLGARMCPFSVPPSSSHGPAMKGAAWTPQVVLCCSGLPCLMLACLLLQPKSRGPKPLGDPGTFYLLLSTASA